MGCFIWKCERIFWRAVLKLFFFLKVRMSLFIGVLLRDFVVRREKNEEICCVVKNFEILNRRFLFGLVDFFIFRVIVSLFSFRFVVWLMLNLVLRYVFCVLLKRYDFFVFFKVYFFSTIEIVFLYFSGFRDFRVGIFFIFFFKRDVYCVFVRFNSDCR